MRLSLSRNSRLAATSFGASVCQAAGLELERDVNDGGVRPVCPALWEPISGGFCAGLGDMPERRKSTPSGATAAVFLMEPTRPPPRRTT
jgi:hypothetical protein